MTISTAAVLLFLVLDPFGNLPFFLSALANVPEARRRPIIARELLVALAVLVFMLLAGRWVLRLLGISEPALSIAGGIILFLIALRMIFPGARGVFDEDVEGEPFIVPLAIPYVAGPSAMASVLLIMSREPARWPEWLAALGLAWAATGAILLAAPSLSRLFGKRGLIAMERLMGMVLTALAVEMFLDGLGRHPAS